MYNRSLTEGEAPLAVNIVNRSYSELVKPLDQVQAAPIGFLWLQKFMISAFGNNEFAFRFIPLIAGIAALFVFYRVTSKIMNRNAALVGLILFSVNDQLIYFSSELKQYSTDVLAALLLLLVTVDVLDNDYRILRMILLGVTGAVSIWFSHPSVFVFCASIVVLSGSMVRLKTAKKLAWLLIPIIAGIVSFLFDYAVSLKSLSQHRAFLDFWRSSFMPLPPKSWVDFKWFVYSFLRIFKNPGGFSVFDLLLAVISFFVGAVVCYRTRKVIFAVLLLPVFLVLLASGLHKYPFEGRLLLFIVPFITMMIAQGVEFMRGRSAQGSKTVGMLLVTALVLYPVMLAGYHLVKPRAPEELKLVLQYLKDHKQENDVIYVYYGAVNGFRYYADRFGYENGDFVAGVEARHDWPLYYQDLKKLKGNARVWVLLSHICDWAGVDEEMLFISYLEILGKKLDAFSAPGAAAYLYDLRGSP